MATPHISAAPGEIAPLVVMPGDPRRAERIAKDHFDDVRLVSDVRGIQAWTGRYENTPITAMASGMGIPSLSIYATELYRFHGVQRICRVGTCGGIAADIKVRDVAIGSAAHTNSRVATIMVPDVTVSLAASFDMLRGAVDAGRALAKDTGPQIRVGALYSSDFFYEGRPEIIDALQAIGTLGVEMEAAGLYACALAEGREALAVCTVSDHLKDGAGDMTAEERETSFLTSLKIGVAGLLA